MASLIDPACGMEAYTQTEGVAARCGGYSGVLAGALLGIAGAVALSMALTALPLAARIALAVLVVLLSAGLAYVLGGFLGRRALQIGQAELRAREAQGMTKQEALSSVQNLENSRRNANATLQAGSLLAGALISR